MSRRGTESDAAPGQDSLLDVIANLVGILIILVVLVGAHAGSTIAVSNRADSSRQPDSTELHRMAEELAAIAAETAAMQSDLNRLQERVAEEQALVVARAAERDTLLVHVTYVERKLDERLQQLSQAQRQRIDEARHLQDLQQRLTQLQREAAALENNRPQRHVIHHQPTPIAKTVLTDEVHFRLLDGRLAYVPMNELVERMQAEWHVKATRLETAPRTVETVGPIENFRLQYELEMVTVAVPTQLGSIDRSMVRFNRFILVATDPQIGQPLHDAFVDGSDFRRRIDRLDPSRVTVSIWVYPDSFHQYNELKRWLYERGFQVACWPLAADRPISGSPEGHRSTAQ